MPPQVIQQQYITLAAQNQAHRCALLILPIMLQIFVCCLSLDSASHVSGPVSCIDIAGAMHAIQC